MRTFVPVIIAALSTFLYHIAARLTPSNASPLLSLAVTYVAAAVLCGVLLLFFPLGVPLREAVGRLNWASLGLAVAVTGIEVGFLLAYRLGWQISLTTIVVNVAAAALLLPAGLLLFKERVTPINALGILICLVGLAMVNQK